MTIRPYPQPGTGARPWRAELLASLSPRELTAAFACFLSAAASGNPEGQNLLGRCHDNGWGTPADKEAARRCYKAAAEGGDYQGAHNHACALASDAASPGPCTGLKRR